MIANLNNTLKNIYITISIVYSVASFATWWQNKIMLLKILKNNSQNSAPKKRKKKFEKIFPILIDF
jgi:hypothetical protein